MESTLRPWIGFVDFKLDYNQLNVKLKNHGSIPAKIIQSFEVLSSTKITQEQLRSSKDNLTNEFNIFPDSDDTYEMLINEPQQDNFVGLLFKYTYAVNKDGECGIIAKYDDKKEI